MAVPQKTATSVTGTPLVLGSGFGRQGRGRTGREGLLKSTPGADKLGRRVFTRDSALASPMASSSCRLVAKPSEPSSRSDRHRRQPARAVQQVPAAAARK